MQRSSSALGVSLDAIPKEAPNLRFSEPQVATSGKDGYSNSTDNTFQPTKQEIPNEIAALSPRALPLPFSYYPTPLGIGIPQDTLQTSVYQSQPNCANTMAKKPPPMGFSNDARNLVSQATGIIATQAPQIQRAMYMGYQIHPLGAENQHPKDMSGFGPGTSSDQTKRVFSDCPIALSFRGDNFSNQPRHLPNDHPAGLPFSPHTGGRGSDRRFSLHQQQSAFHQPAAASGLGIMSAMMPTVTKPYRHYSVGQPSNPGDWPQEGNQSSPMKFTTAMGFSDHLLSRQHGVQRHAHEAQKDFRRFDERYLYIGLFPNHVTLDELQNIFACCGPIDHMDPPRNSRNPNTRNGCNAYSFVRSVTPALFS